MSPTDHHIVISADTHCGADLRQYKPYLETKYHDDFESWAAIVEEQRQAQEKQFEGKSRSTRNVGVDGDPVLDADRNWSSDRRLAEQQADGVVGYVLFPNTQPPFAPTASTRFEAPPVGDDFEHRWAGLRAHNRWLVDLVAEAPVQRAGICQIFLGDPEGSAAEIEWAAENGLRGGVLLPGAPPDSGLEPHYSPSYEPIWSAAAANGMPVNHHSGGGSPSYGSYFPASLAIFMLEVTWWNQRALWQLMFSGVFERHPDLDFVLTESGTAWVTDTLARLDSFYDRMKNSEYGSEAIFGGMAVKGMSLTPSEYWSRQCHVGASFLRPSEIELRHDVGLKNILWGSDYPHIEGSHPYTHEHLRLTFGGVPVDDTVAMLTTNTASLYGFDLDALKPLAAEHCPTKDEVFAGIDYSDIPDKAKGCPGMAPHAQVEAA